MLKKYALTAITALLAALFFAGCAHSEKSAISKVETGMSKAEVLELAGNPNHTGRKLNADVWLYVDSASEQGRKTEIYFQDGKVSYIGEPKAEKPTDTTSGKAFRPVGQ